MPRPISTQERARRQRAMIQLRNWMEKHDVSRKEMAAQMGITKGHLSTLINANRTASLRQVEVALSVVDGSVPRPIPPVSKRAQKPKAKPDSAKPVSEKVRRPNDLRPMNKFETEFVVTVAKAWLDANAGGDRDDFIEIVRALSIGIRS